MPFPSRPSRRLLAVALLAGSLLSLPARAEEAVRVFAAASLTSALTEIGGQWTAAGHPAPSLAFGASSALARQVEAGAPADLFASADARWIDHLDARDRIVTATRVELLGNALVLIAPKGRAFRAELRTGFDLPGAFAGKLCTGEPDVVPVGTYAKQALGRLGWWDALSGRIVGTDDVRTALAFVERGECPAGIVYATDAAISAKVEVVARFPADSHAPIVYPFALVRGGRGEAQTFLDHLRTPAAAAVFERLGFVVLPSAP